MRIVSPITDYIRESILTTKGDLIVMGDSQPERLAAGTDGYYLMSNGAGEIPSYEDVFGFLTDDWDLITYNGGSVIRFENGVAGEFLSCNAPGGGLQWDDPLELLTTNGDLITQAGGAHARLAAGSSGDYLKSQGSGSSLTWGDPIEDVINTQGDMIYRGATHPVDLSIGAPWSILGVDAGGTSPLWYPYSVMFDYVMLNHYGWNEKNEILIHNGSTGQIINLDTLVQVYTDGDQYVAASDEDIVEFDTELTDDNSEFNTSTYKFEPANSGFYHIDCNLLLAFNNGAGTVNVRIKKNDSTYMLCSRYQFVDNSQFTIHISGIVELTDSDDLEVYVGATTSQVDIIAADEITYLHINRIPHLQ